MIYCWQILQKNKALIAIHRRWFPANFWIQIHWIRITISGISFIEFPDVLIILETCTSGEVRRWLADRETSLSSKTRFSCSAFCQAKSYVEWRKFESSYLFSIGRILQIWKRYLFCIVFDVCYDRLMCSCTNEPQWYASVYAAEHGLAVLLYGHNTLAFRGFH